MPLLEHPDINAGMLARREHVALALKGVDLLNCEAAAFVLGVKCGISAAVRDTATASVKTATAELMYCCEYPLSGHGVWDNSIGGGWRGDALQAIIADGVYLGHRGLLDNDDGTRKFHTSFLLGANIGISAVMKLEKQHAGRTDEGG